MTDEEALQEQLDQARNDPDFTVVENVPATTSEVAGGEDVLADGALHMVEGLISPKSGNYVQLVARGSDLDHVLATFVIQARFIASQTEDELMANAAANGGQLKFPAPEL